jgi:hypothetical protein
MNFGTGVSLSSGTLLTQLQLEVELHDYPDVCVLLLEQILAETQSHWLSCGRRMYVFPRGR